MDILVQIPNAKVPLVVEALNASPTPGWTPPAEGATATQIGNAVKAFYVDKWTDELRATVVQHRRQTAIRAAVDADAAKPDPLA